MENILYRNIDLKRWEKIGNRVIVYGRRKTGKSFFIKNFTKWDEYFFVKRDSSLIDVKNNKEISYEVLKDLLLRNRKRIVIDEFHRLPNDFLDFLHANAEKLNLVLITSTLWLSRKILSESSPLLGIFEEFKIGLIDERDAINFLKEKLSGKELIDSAIYIREPWQIPLIKRSIYDEIPRILKEEKNTIERLIGEIFREEERELRKSYLAILECIANGKQKSTEISHDLFNKKIIEKDDASLIQSYLKILVNVGIIRKLKILNKKFDLYIHDSPILDLYFYLDSKYGFSELEISEGEIRKIFMKKLPLHAEDFFRNLLAKIFDLKAGKIIEKDYDIDIVLHSFKKIKFVAEVKWKEEIEESEIEKIEAILNKFPQNVKKVLIIPKKEKISIIPEKIEVWDVNDILKLISS